MYDRIKNKIIHLQFWLFVVPNEILELVDSDLGEEEFRHRWTAGNISASSTMCWDSWF